MIAYIGTLVDRLEAAWDHRISRRVRGGSLVLVLLGGIILIEVFRPLGDDNRPAWMPRVHLAAISWAISLLLLYELVEMAFAISKSVASSMTRYLQLYALVLLRDAFLKLDAFPEPIRVGPEQLQAIGIMTADAAGGIVLFVVAGLFERLQRHTPIAVTVADAQQFKRWKKTIVVALLLALAALCVARVASLATPIDALPVLETYFTALVFVDVLLAFVTLAFTSNPAIVFRNFGFAFAAILLRFSLASPAYIRPSIAIVGGLVAIIVTVAYNLGTDNSAAPPDPRDDEPDTPKPDPTTPTG